MKKICAILLVLMLLPIAAMAEDYGSMTLITYRVNRDGVAPEYLNEYVQPLGIISEDGGLRVELLDALFLDKAIAVAWTVENTSDEPLYIIDDCSVGGANMMPYARGFQFDELKPGEKRKCGFAGYLRDDDLKMDTDKEAPLILHVSGSRVLGEAVDRDEVIAGMPQQEEFDYLAFDREVSRLFAEESKLVLGLGGYIEPGAPDPSFLFDESSAVPYAAQRYIHNGMLALESLASIELPLRHDAAIRSILPDEPVEAVVGGGVMRLTKAMLSPVGLIVEASFTFPDEETALVFYNGKLGDGPWPVTILDAAGARTRNTPGFSGFPGEDGRISMEQNPTKQEDGTYVWPYIFEHWYLVSEADVFYLLLDTSKLSGDGVYTGDLTRDAEVIRLGG